MNKFIIGWVTFKPEKRDELMEAIEVFAAATRQESGCVFFEINLSRERPNCTVVAECFQSAEAHDEHQKTPHVKAFFEKTAGILVEGRFENILSDNVVVDIVKF